MTIAKTTLGEHRHACAFFHSTEQQYRVLLPFIRDGFVRGDEDETKVNYLCRGTVSRSFRSHGLARIRGDIVMDIMRTHAVTIIAGPVRSNPLFVPPDEFLGELRNG